MASYFFDLATGDEVERDLYGDELPDLATARQEAVLYLLEKTSETALDASSDINLKVIVRDDSGVEVLSVSLNIALASNSPTQREVAHP